MGKKGKGDFFPPYWTLFLRSFNNLTQNPAPNLLKRENVRKGNETDHFVAWECLISETLEYHCLDLNSGLVLYDLYQNTGSSLL